MSIFYWPDYTPAGYPKAFIIRPFLDNNIAIEDIPKWCEDNNWSKDPDSPNAVMVLMGSWWSDFRNGWVESSSRELFKGDHGLVTIESVAYHIRRGQENWNRPGFTHTILDRLNAVKKAGYNVQIIAMDIEAGVPTAGADYKHWEDTNHFTMREVIKYLYSNDRWVRKGGLPELDVEAVCDPNPWGSNKKRQAMIIWNQFAHAEATLAWEHSIGLPAIDLFPEVIVNNYDFSCFEGAPMLDFNSGLPRPDAAIFSDSAPVLYLQEGYGFRQVNDALSAFSAVQKAVSRVPWIAGPYREGARGWHVTRDKFTELAKRLQDPEEFDCKHLCIF